MSKNSYTSKGERNNVARWHHNALRRDRTVLETSIIKLKAFKKGKKVYLTIPNPNTKETNKKFIRIKASDYWTKTGSFMMSRSSD